MARLLVSVRSADEAALASGAGAAMIDVKEPGRGSLGQAHWSVWREVRRVTPPALPVSVALGELIEWLDAEPLIPADAWSGLAFRKLGLAGGPSDWKAQWAWLRAHPALAAGPPWIAVAYADWRAAGAPNPDAVLEAAAATPEITGVLVDTWCKLRPFQPDDAWAAWARRVRRAGLALAIAGSLDLAAMGRLGSIAPDIVAVRGAACVRGRREAAIDPLRVAQLARRVAKLPESDEVRRLPWSHGVISKTTP